MEQLTILIYPSVAIISIIAYIPQIKALVKAQKDDHTISLASWSIWCLSTLITCMYGFSHLHDVMFNMVASLNLILVHFTTSIIIYNKYFRFSSQKISIQPKERNRYNSRTVSYYDSL